MKHMVCLGVKNCFFFDGNGWDYDPANGEFYWVLLLNSGPSGCKWR